MPGQIVFAAIDFGTTFSGTAFAFKHTLENNRKEKEIIAKNWKNGLNISPKTPTCALIGSDGETLVAFGYEAEDKYVTLVEEGEHGDYYFFQRFKMLLHSKGVLKRTTILEDVAGKRLPALKVFQLSINYLKNDLIRELDKKVQGGIRDTDIYWALTVPAIWSEGAKKFMREAALKAGIHNDRLTIVLEPECASILCRQLNIGRSNEDGKTVPLNPGEKYVIVDCGGGTVDICCHEVAEDRRLREVHVVRGDSLGGTTVDQAFEQMLIQIFTEDVWKEFKTDNLDNYIDMFRSFEIEKRKVSTERESQLRIYCPATLVEMFNRKRLQILQAIAPIIPNIEKEFYRQVYVNDTITNSVYAGKLNIGKDKLFMASDLCISNMYQKAITGIKNLLFSLFQHENVADCTSILLVGGFGESQLVQDSIKEWFPNKCLVVPNDAMLAVVKGAVIYGYDSSIIVQRMARYTYGRNNTVLFDDSFNNNEKELFPDGVYRVRAFKPLIRYGEAISTDHCVEVFKAIPILDDQICICIKLYAVDKEDQVPRVVDHPNCIELGNLLIPISDMTLPTEQRRFRVRLKFGGTEISANVTELSSGKVVNGKFDFLG